MSKKPICPKCKSKRILKIIYGMPVYSKIDPEKHHIGGCMIEADENGNPLPYYHCRDCGHEFDKEPDEFSKFLMGR